MDIVIFLLTSAFGIAGLLLGKHIGHRQGYDRGYMVGHEHAMNKMTSRYEERT